MCIRDRQSTVYHSAIHCPLFLVHSLLQGIHNEYKQRHKKSLLFFITLLTFSKNNPNLIWLIPYGTVSSIFNYYFFIFTSLTVIRPTTIHFYLFLTNGATLTLSVATHNPVSYTHLDVYKRQPPHLSKIPILLIA